jgi:xanthine dehydrogenase accessory factor
MAEVLAVKNSVTLPRDMEVAAAKNAHAIAHNPTRDARTAAVDAPVCGVGR